MAEELYIRLRPTTFEEVYGQDTATKQLAGFIAKGKMPHASLFSGPSGCGKTTLARIVKNELGCGDNDYFELNGSKNRGIDDMRDLEQKSRMRPLSGKCRIWVIDECFDKNTLIETENGAVPIAQIQTGNIVKNAVGCGVVEKVFKNKIPLNRLAKLTFDDGRELFTTVDHELLTKDKWEFAASSLGACVLSMRCYTIQHENSMCLLQRTQTKTLDGMLFQKLRRQIKATKVGQRANRNSHLSRMLNRIHSKKIKPQALLQSQVCQTTGLQETRVQRENSQRYSTGENTNHQQSIRTNATGERNCSPNGRKVEEIQPSGDSRNNSQSEGNQNSQRDTTYLAWEEGGKRTIYNTPTYTMESLGPQRLGNGICNQNRHETPHSVCLQIRHCLPFTSIKHRSRWTQVEKDFVKRQKEDKNTCEIRVVRVEVYQPGNNDRSFEGVVDNKEKNQGFAEFYDLQVSNHPSYFANGVPVHNCHGLTGDAQNAILKLLEDTPSQAYFILLSTDPNKLKKAIQTRCTHLQLRSLPEATMLQMLRDVCKRDKIKLHKATAEQIVQVAAGSARQALVLLDQCCTTDDEDEQIEIVGRASAEIPAYNLFKELIGKPNWGRVSTILKSIDGEPESIRRMILACARTALLGNGGAKANKILVAFSENYFDTGAAGLAASCWEVVNG